MIVVHKLSVKQWEDLAEKAHGVVFNESRPAHFDRVDFALVAVDDDQKLMIGYTTMREISHDTIYWQYGGSFPEYRGTPIAAKGYALFIQWCKEHGYKRITTLIENNNKAMLKLAAFNDFIIVGVRNFKGKVLLEHGLEFTE